MKSHGSGKKLLILSGRPLTLLGGTTSDIIYEVEQLARLGYITCLMCPLGNADKLTNGRKFRIINPSDKKYKFLPGPFYRLAHAIHRSILVKKIDSSEHFHYIHAHDVFSALASVLALRSKKTILHLHSISARDRFVMSKPFSSLSLGLKCVHSILYLMTCLLEIFVYNTVRLIVCVSEWERDDAIRKDVFNRKRIFILRNGIDVDTFRPKPEIRFKLRQRFDISSNHQVCIFLGRLVPKNGPMLIAQAIPTVNQRITDITFVFVGNGGERKELISYITKYNLPNVLCLETTPAEEILPIGDIFVSHVSSLVDGHGQTILEAMGSGIPTITGRDPIKERLFEDDEIVLIDKDSPAAIAEAIIALVTNKDKQKVLSLKGREKVVKEFSISLQYERFNDMLALIRG